MKKSIFKIIVLFLNILVVVALLLTALTQYIAPYKLSFFSYLGTFFLPLVLINACFVLLWLSNLKWYFIISLVSILLVMNSINISFSWRKKEIAKTEDCKEVKVMTYNVMLFNYYKKNSKILEYIGNSDADIVCLQEFGWHKNGRDFLSKEKILEALKKYPYHHINLSMDSKKVTYGIAVFSKYPIVNHGKIEYVSNFSSSVYVDVKIFGDTIRVFNNHLESNNLTKNDKDNLTGKLDSEVLSNTAKKLGSAAALRGKQADAVANAIAGSPYPVIVCGDFNDVPVSYTYRTIKRNLNDAFAGSGSGIGVTYSERLLYRFRLDNILAGPQFQYFDYAIHPVEYSDHYPVSCIMTLSNDN